MPLDQTFDYASVQLGLEYKHKCSACISKSLLNNNITYLNNDLSEKPQYFIIILMNV